MNIVELEVEYQKTLRSKLHGLWNLILQVQAEEEPPTGQSFPNSSPTLYLSISK
jgi:hypothetical protein